MTDTFEFFVAGVQFHELKNVIGEVEVGDILNLVPEPENKYDPNAVRIIYNGTMTGYVPKKFSDSIAALLEIELDMQCEVIELNRSAKPWEQLRVRISELGDADESKHIDPEDEDWDEPDMDEEGDN